MNYYEYIPAYKKNEYELRNFYNAIKGHVNIIKKCPSLNKAVIQTIHALAIKQYSGLFGGIKRLASCCLNAIRGEGFRSNAVLAERLVKELSDSTKISIVFNTFKNSLANQLDSRGLGRIAANGENQAQLENILNQYLEGDQFDLSPDFIASLDRMDVHLKMAIVKKIFLKKPPFSGDLYHQLLTADTIQDIKAAFLAIQDPQMRDTTINYIRFLNRILVAQANRPVGSDAVMTAKALAIACTPNLYDSGRKDVTQQDAIESEKFQKIFIELIEHPEIFA